MKLEIPTVKKYVIPVRLSEELFVATQKIAKKNKAAHSTVLRLLIERAVAAK